MTVTVNRNALRRFTLSGLAGLLLALPSGASAPGSAPGQFSHPNEVALNTAGDAVYVVDTANDRVQKFASNGTFLTEWGGFDTPTSVAVHHDASGNVFVGEAGGGQNRVVQFDADGTLLSSFNVTGKVQSLAVATGGTNVWVALSTENEVQRMVINSGNINVSLSATATPPFAAPGAVAVIPGTDDLYVADNNGIYKFRRDQSTTTQLDFWPVGYTVAAIAVGANGNVYVADRDNNKIRKLDGADLSVQLAEITTGGEGPFNIPRGVAVGGFNVWATDRLNHRLVRLNPSLAFEQQWPGIDPIAVSLPDQEKLYDSDVTLPVTVGSTSGREIIAAEIFVRFDNQLMAAFSTAASSVSLSGTLLEGLTGNDAWTIETNIVDEANPNKVLRIALATGGAPLQGAGDLIKINMRTRDVRQPNTTTLELDLVEFNNGVPASTTTNGSVKFLGNQGTVTMTPSTIIPRESLDITVDDVDADLDGLPGTDQITVTVTNTTNGDTHVKPLLETATAGEFTAAQATQFGETADPGTPKIEARRDDVIEVVYVDELTQNGGTANRTDQSNVTGGFNGSVDITDVTEPGDVVRIRVEDGDLNVVFSAIESASVIVTSDNGDAETVIVTEVDVDDDGFFGTIGSNGGSVVVGDGVINAAKGDVLTVTYDDVVTWTGDQKDRTSTDQVIDPFGDANGDGAVGAFDAAQVLQHVLVPHITGLELLQVNVSSNQSNGVTPFDASLILRKRVKLISVFPVQEASSENHPQSDPVSPKRATESRWLSLEPADGYLSVVADTRDGILSGDVLLTGVHGRVEVAPELAQFLVASHEVAGGIRVVFAGAHATDGPGELLRIHGPAESAEIIEATLNDGQFTALGTGKVSTATPQETTLVGNYPNPFNPETHIRFELVAASRVDLTVYDMLGQTVRTLVAETLPAGSHATVWDGRNARGEAVGNGVYLYRLRAGDVTQMRSMLLLK